VVLVQALEEHVEHGNVPDSPVTLPGSVTLATVLPAPCNIFPPVSGKSAAQQKEILHAAVQKANEI
jgi:hypothetical protein